jgi:hypothetical protein
MIVFIYKWLKNAGFRSNESLRHAGQAEHGMLRTQKSLVVALELVRPWCLSRQAPDSNEDSNWKARGSYLVFNFKTLLLPNGFIIDRERSTVESLTSLNSVRKSTSFPDAP